MRCAAQWAGIRGKAPGGAAVWLNVCGPPIATAKLRPSAKPRAAPATTVPSAAVDYLPRLPCWCISSTTNLHPWPATRESAQLGFAAGAAPRETFLRTLFAALQTKAGRQASRQAKVSFEQGVGQTAVHLPLLPGAPPRLKQQLLMQLAKTDCCA
jgi:hypothetical protein